jgi:hypothetical protein
MANEEHLKIIRQGVAAWNDWRRKNPQDRIDLVDAYLGRADLSGADLSEVMLSGASLGEANLSEANLCEANLCEAKLWGANLRGANLSRAYLGGAYLAGADLSRADVSRADLGGAYLGGANLSEAYLWEADLSGAQLISTNLHNATLTGSTVYGVSVWDIKVNDRTKQQNLIITSRTAPVITVDNIKIAQFIYLLLNNQEIRDVIDTITSKAVLILGRFSEDRKPILGAIRDELRKPEHNYLPIMFDFRPLTSQTTVETIKTLAGMARFVIADLTDARSVLEELAVIVPAFPRVAVRLLLKKSEHEYGMLDYIRSYKSVVENTYEYEDLDEVIATINKNIILPAEVKVKELRQGD